MNKNLIIALVIVVVLCAGIGGLIFLRGDEDTWLCSSGQWVKHGNPSAPQPTTPCAGAVACTMEAKICPDGSTVGREGPNCEFKECPVVNTAPSANNSLKTYTNDKYGFSFQYPSDWVLTENSDDKIVYLRSPETKILLDQGKVDPAYSIDFSVVFGQNVNSESIKGGDTTNYKNLNDLLTSKNSDIQKVGEIAIDNHQAYEISSGGQGLSYGIMIEYKGIYLLLFSTAWDKTKLNSDQKQILSSFKFTK